MTTRAFTVSGRHFGSMRHEGLLKPASQLIDERESLITRLFSDCTNPVDKDALNQLLFERMRQNEAIDKLFERWKQDIRAYLEENHELAKAAVLAQQEKIQKAKEEVAENEMKATRLAEKRFKAQGALQTAIEARNGLSPYTSRKEIERAEAAVETAQEKVNEIGSNQTLYENAARQIIFTILPKLHAELMELTGAEREANAAITGESYQHSSGLIVPRAF